EGEGDFGTHTAGVTLQSRISTSDSRNWTATGPRPQLQWVSVIGSSPVDWYAISAEQADALPHVWQKGASAMGGLALVVLRMADLCFLGRLFAPVIDDQPVDEVGGVL